MSYILVADDEREIREIFEIVLKRSFSHEVVLVCSGQEAIEMIQNRGEPLVVVSDFKMPDGDGYFLYQQLLARNSTSPFILCSTDVSQYAEKFSGAFDFIEKPNVVKPLLESVGKILGPITKIPVYISVGMSLFLRRGTSHYDLYMKLSDKKYVKVFNAGDAFTLSDAFRFKSKGIESLYIANTDAEKFLQVFEQNIQLVLKSSQNSVKDLPEISLETLETVERISRGLGWTPEVITSAKQAVELAVKAIASEPDLYKLLKSKLANPSSLYSQHISLLSLISWGMSHQLGWQSESTQMKLGLAALMHDVAVDEAIYQNLGVWNKAASDPMNKNPEVSKYRNHPIAAAELLMKMKGLPADVDQIILQHHESKDGLGFPRGLTSTRISPMATIFIISEDLINFISHSENIETAIRNFIKEKTPVYNSGNFRKVFEAFKDSVEQLF